MQKHSAEMRRCLTECDVGGIRRLWAHVSPHLPQPGSDAEALASIHMSRTAMSQMPFRLRAYSHRWLCDNGLPSQLPDNLKPKAERIYPKIVVGIGVAVRGSSELGRAVAPLVQRAIQDAIEDCYANGDTETEIVRARMQEARRDAMKKLLAKIVT